MTVSVIAGLGNPGAKYQHTRHNIGFDAVDALAAAQGATWKEEKRFFCLLTKITLADRALTLVKPQTFMNDSGRSLGAVLRFLKLPPQAMCVIYDDITLEAGRVKLSVNGSDGGHNGIASILKDAGNGFVRYRIGIGGKGHPEMKLADWVLGKQSADEKAIHSARMPDYLKGVELLLQEGVERAMNQLNTRT